MMSFKSLKHKWILLIIVLIICALILCLILPSIRFSLSKKRVEDAVAGICGFTHFSVQLSKGEPSSGTPDCDFLTHKTDPKKIVGNPVANRKISTEGMQYKFDLLIHSPDNKDKLTIKVYVIRNQQLVDSSLEKYAFSFNGNMFIATIDTYLYDVGKTQIAEMLNQVTQMDPRFDFYVTYDSFFS